MRQQQALAWIRLPTLTTAMREIERCEKIIATVEQNRSSGKTVLEWAEAPDLERAEA